MTSQNASLKPTVTSASPSISVVADQRPTGTNTGRVIYMDLSSPERKIQVEGAIDIDDLVAELESLSPGNAKAIAEGRGWVADNFYSDKQGVAYFRLKMGWSQAELARRAETSQPYIARLELGKVDPQISTARKIAKVLGISIETFVDAMDSEAQK